jgi:hypothetical protein
MHTSTYIATSYINTYRTYINYPRRYYFSRSCFCLVTILCSVLFPFFIKINLFPLSSYFPPSATNSSFPPPTFQVCQWPVSRSTICARQWTRTWSSRTSSCWRTSANISSRTREIYIHNYWRGNVAMMALQAFPERTVVPEHWLVSGGHTRGSWSATPGALRYSRQVGQ